MYTDFSGQQFDIEGDGLWFVRLDRADGETWENDDGDRVWPMPAFFLTHVAEDSVFHTDLGAMPYDMTERELACHVMLMWDDVKAKAIRVLKEQGRIAVAGQVRFERHDGPTDCYALRCWEVHIDTMTT